MIYSIIKDKNIAVTGGTGTIGSAIVSECLKSKAKSIKIFSNDENGLYELEEKFLHNPKLKFIIGDIRDKTSVRNAIKHSEIVFHAAALKHVDRCELNPQETISVNILGTQNVIESSISEKIKKVISISTDKAVNPIGVMGATKLLSEKLISSEALYQNSQTIFSTVRFGNVLHSRGSIIPRIQNQIKRGGPITLTDKRMQRFFMTIDQAVNLILSATKLAKGGEIFVMKMPLMKLEDLFEGLKQFIAPKHNLNPSQIQTKIIGIRPGEKLIEYLLTDYEIEQALETKDFFIIQPPQYKRKKINYPELEKSKNIDNYFENLKPLNKLEIDKLLKTLNYD